MNGEEREREREREGDRERLVNKDYVHLLVDET